MLEAVLEGVFEAVTDEVEVTVLEGVRVLLIEFVVVGDVDGVLLLLLVDDGVLAGVTSAVGVALETVCAQLFSFGLKSFPETVTAITLSSSFRPKWSWTLNFKSGFDPN